MDEAGIEFRTGGWWGLVMSSQTPDPIVRRVNAELARAYQDPKIVEFMDSQFLEPAAGTPEQFAAFLKQDRQRAGEVVRRFNIKE